jgi:glutamate-5-semialdehyde dehydrogenase
VFADATGVLRTGNTAVLRIGSDALGTAEAIMRHALAPALAKAGLPAGSVSLVASQARAAGWALFNDHRLSLAIARGSGEAVAQLGAVARQAGVPVSLHGTGGAWMMAATTADADRFRDSVLYSLDRKVCNTLNVCCIVVDRAADLVPLMDHPRGIGLAEFMNFPGVLMKDAGCLDKLEAFRGRHIDGHAPLLRGRAPVRVRRLSTR